MSTVHLMCGYIGFGKTTIAKQLEKQLGARRFTPDEVMIELFGTEVGDDFMDKANKVDEYIWEQIALAVKNDQDVIYDAGSWSVDDRKYVMQRLKKLGANALWHQVNCDIDLAKQRTWRVVKMRNSCLLMNAFLMKIYLDISLYLILRA